jgi:hypothetical protein
LATIIAAAATSLGWRAWTASALRRNESGTGAADISARAAKVAPDDAMTALGPFRPFRQVAGSVVIGVIADIGRSAQNDAIDPQRSFRQMSMRSIIREAIPL